MTLRYLVQCPILPGALYEMNMRVYSRKVSVELKMRVLLPVLMLGLQFAVSPCAMAMPMESSGDCEHCDSVDRPSNCIVAAVHTAVDADSNSKDRLRAAPPSGGLAGILPLPAVPQTLQRAEYGAIAIARRTGRHSGDPPLHLLHGIFLN